MVPAKLSMWPHWIAKIVIASTAYFEARTIAASSDTREAHAPNFRIETRSLGGKFPAQPRRKLSVETAGTAFLFRGCALCQSLRYFLVRLSIDLASLNKGRWSSLR
jgi:hypothetical protein